MNELLDVFFAWFWSHLDQIRNWVTLTFAAVAAYVGLARHMRDRAASRDARSERWSLRSTGIAPTGDPHPPQFVLRLRDASEHPLRLNSISIRKPRGARIAKTKYTVGKSGHQEKSPSTFSTKLVYDRDLNGDFRTGGGPSTDSSIQIYIKMPQKPLWSRSSKPRLKVLIEAEEMSSHRAAIRLHVRSEPIAWASNNADIAQ